jgi:hypothetical protein
MSSHSLRRRSSFGLPATSSNVTLTRKMSVISPSALTGHLNQDVVVQIAILVSVCNVEASHVSRRRRFVHAENLPVLFALIKHRANCMLSFTIAFP